jgi:hypothetical protein
MLEKKKKKEDKWWKRPPRSSRICLRCNHKYSSHIDVKCLKIVSRKPREECSCKGFIANEYELELANNREKNALKGEIDNSL